jgi:hypothetical protein
VRADLVPALTDGIRIFHLWFGIGTVVKVRLRLCVCVLTAWPFVVPVKQSACFKRVSSSAAPRHPSSPAAANRNVLH